MGNRAYSYVDDSMSREKIFSICNEYIKRFNDPESSFKLKQLRFLSEHIWDVENYMTPLRETGGINDFCIAMRDMNICISLSFDEIRNLLAWSISWEAKNDERTCGYYHSNDLSDCISKCIGQIKGIDMWLMDSHIKLVKTQLEGYLGILEKMR